MKFQHLNFSTVHEAKMCSVLQGGAQKKNQTLQTNEMVNQDKNRQPHMMMISITRKLGNKNKKQNVELDRKTNVCYKNVLQSCLEVYHERQKCNHSIHRKYRT